MTVKPKEIRALAASLLEMSLVHSIAMVTDVIWPNIFKDLVILAARKRCFNCQGAKTATNLPVEWTGRGKTLGTEWLDADAMNWNPPQSLDPLPANSCGGWPSSFFPLSCSKSATSANIEKRITGTPPKLIPATTQPGCEDAAVLRATYLFPISMSIMPVKEGQRWPHFCTLPSII